MQRLQELKTKEISLVSSAANRRRFMVFKSAGKKMTTHEELQKAIASADPDTMKRVSDFIDRHMTNDAEGNPDGMDIARTAMKAIARIASNVKGKFPPQVMHGLVDEVGFKMPDAPAGKDQGEMGGAGATSVGESPTHGETVNMGMEAIPEEELKKAADCARKAYEEHMKKLGHREYPDAQIQMKSKTGKAMKEDDEDEEDMEEMEKKEKKEAKVKKSADLETQTKLESIFKENSDLKAEIAALQLVNKQRELVQKAAAFSDLGIPQDMIVQTLIDAEKVGKESFDRVMKQYEMLSEQTRVAKSFGGNLFSEIGSSLPGNSGGATNTWEKIEKAALSAVEKSGEKTTKADAIAAFLNTPEGTRLYAEHQASRKDGI